MTNCAGVTGSFGYNVAKEFTYAQALLATQSINDE